MNRAERTTIAELIRTADEEGFTCPAMERLRRLLVAQGSPVASIPRKAPKRTTIPPAQRRAVYDRSGGFCEASTPACLDGPHRAQEIHHRAGRRGPDPHRLENLLHVCSDGHRYITEHPLEALEAGWSAKRLGVEG